MRYALTVNLTGGWDAVTTYIIEDGLMDNEFRPESWRDGGEALVNILVALGHPQKEAENIVRWKDYYIVNCDDIDLNLAEMIPNPPKPLDPPQNGLQCEIEGIPGDSISLVKKELENILELATCDDTLFNDGINLEIEVCAKKGLDILEEN